MTSMEWINLFCQVHPDEIMFLNLFSTLAVQYAFKFSYEYNQSRSYKKIGKIQLFIRGTGMFYCIEASIGGHTVNQISIYGSLGKILSG